jgi:hypothetical protein
MWMKAYCSKRWLQSQRALPGMSAGSSLPSVHNRTGKNGPSFWALLTPAWRMLGQQLHRCPFRGAALQLPHQPRSALIDQAGINKKNPGEISGRAANTTYVCLNEFLGGL